MPMRFTDDRMRGRTGVRGDQPPSRRESPREATGREEPGGARRRSTRRPYPPVYAVEGPTRGDARTVKPGARLLEDLGGRGVREPVPGKMKSEGAEKRIVRGAKKGNVEFAGERVLRKKAPDEERRSRTGVRILIGAALVASLAALVWVYMFTGVLNVRRVEVRGNRRLDSAYLRSISGITSDTHLLKMDVGSVERAVLAEPYVRNVRIRRRFPRTVILEITERLPIGFLIQNGRYHLVDEEGVVVESRDAPEEGLLEITGVELPILYPGSRVDDQRFREISALLKELPEELLEGSVRVGFAEGEGYYLQTAKTRVIFGGCSEIARKGEIALMALREILPRYGSLQYVDVTFPDYPAVMPAD